MSRGGLLYNLKGIVRNMPIRGKLALSYLVLIILPVLLIGLFSFYRSSELLKNKTQQYTKDILMETGNNIEVKLREVERISFQIISNAEIQGALKRANKGFSDEYEKVASERAIDLQLRGYMTSETDIAAIQILSLSDTTYYINPASIPFSFYSSEADVKRLETRSGSVVWFDTDSGTQTIAVGRAINNLENQQKAGYLFIYLRESSIFNIYKKTELFKNGDFFIINNKGGIVSSKDKTRLGSANGITVGGLELYELSKDFITSNVNGRNCYITFRDIAGTSWRLLSVIPAVEYEKDILWLRGWTVLICVSCCFLAVAFSIAISGSISKPVKRLSVMMTRVGEGDFNVSSNYESKDEIGLLSSHFNKMVSQVQQLIQEVYQEQLLKQKAELKSLRMQINPHFLYNTLESINWMARIKGVPEVGRMVKAMGDLMRASIGGDDFVSIEDEVKNIKNYLMIQTFRYGDRFEVDMEISQEIMSVKIPKLILQPIVENAIVHGFENLFGNGKIEITGQREDSRILFQVRDNGAGIEESVAAALLAGDERNLPQADSHTHIGLRNVDRRIKMYYGQEYGIVIESLRGFGTNVKIQLPLDTGTYPV